MLNAEKKKNIFEIKNVTFKNRLKKEFTSKSSSPHPIFPLQISPTSKANFEHDSMKNKGYITLTPTLFLPNFTLKIIQWLKMKNRWNQLQSYYSLYISTSTKSFNENSKPILPLWFKKTRKTEQYRYQRKNTQTFYHFSVLFRIKKNV